MVNSFVSVIVLTYNSGNTVIETLESIKRQSYKELELIVADDKSTDDTVKICERWIDANRDRFSNCEIIVPSQNTGIAANCNRGVRASHGEWIRLIAGDDLMPDNSISALVNQIDDNKQIIIGAAIDFVGKPENIVFWNDKFKLCPYFFGKDAAFQHKFILYNSDFGLTQGSIINRKVFETVLFDEKYTIIDDLPFWLNVTKAGIKLWGCSSVVTYYRVHESVSHVGDKNLMNVRTSKIQLQIKKDMIMPEIPWYHLFFYETYLIDKFILWISCNVFNNKKTLFSKLVLGVLYRGRLLTYYNRLLNRYRMFKWSSERHV